MSIKISIPDDANSIIERLESNGFTAYVVGGCVRDSLMGREPKDWDICTSATPKEILRVFNEEQVSKVGIEHGTVVVFVNKVGYEITTYRVDGEYTDNRRPDNVKYTSVLLEDLYRRDFTINAMAYNHRTGLVDMFKGYEDIKHKTLRCVGNPTERFSEDALRILRLYRFSSTLGFDIEAETDKSAKKLLNIVDKVSKERVQSELVQLICGKNFLDVMENNSDVMCKIIPELEKCVGFEQHNKYHIFDVYKHSLEAMKYSEPNKIMRLALLLHDTGKPEVCTLGDDGYNHFYGHAKVSKEIAEDVLNRLKFDNKTKETILCLVEEHDRTIGDTEKSIKRVLNKLGEERTRLLLDVKECDIKAHNPEFNGEALERNKVRKELLNRIIEDGQCFSLKDLDINGNDLLEIGFKEGKDIGYVLKRLLDLVLEGELKNEKEVLKERAIILKRVI